MTLPSSSQWIEHPPGVQGIGFDGSWNKKTILKSVKGNQAST